MRLLVVTPDFLSHALPMLTIADAWLRRGHRVVVATGPAMAPLVRTAGMEYSELIMSRGSNAGVLSTRSARDAEARSLDAFFEATRDGMVPTLRFQAEQRATDLLWRPEQVARRIVNIVVDAKPSAVLIDHLAFSASIGLRALRLPYGDVVLGHPSALPVGDELYGVPSAWPPAVGSDAMEMASLRAIAKDTTAAFTEAYNQTLLRLDPSAAAVDDAFAAHGELVLYDYPAELHGPIRAARLPRHAFIGSAVRNETADPDTLAWLARPDRRPIVVVSLGTFLSARTDVLCRIAAALRKVDVRVAMSIGNSDLNDLGDLPADWLVRPSLPQVSLLEHAAVLITHGGNNSVTEALTAGVPMLLLPFSSDQFDGAAAVERHVAGVALDPNRASRALIAGAVRGLLRNPPPSPRTLGRRLRADPGPEVAFAAMSTLPDLLQLDPADPRVGTPISA